MQRRAFVKWAIHGLNAVFGVVLGVPAALFLIDARHRPGRDSDLRTVANLDDLKIETPTEFIIKETRSDAWNLYPDDVIGRVWLIRHQDNKVDAFTTVCPHLGCSVNWTGNQFLCPCHGGRFSPDGTRVLDGGNNPAPRHMDKLDAEVADDPQNPGVKVVKVRYLRFKTNQEAKEEDK
jgi:menaquinol-cytochrome c reductase iron-sulfur subunit